MEGEIAICGNFLERFDHFNGVDRPKLADFSPKTAKREVFIFLRQPWCLSIYLFWFWNFYLLSYVFHNYCMQLHAYCHSHILLVYSMHSFFHNVCFPWTTWTLYINMHVCVYVCVFNWKDMCNGNYHVCSRFLWRCTYCKWIANTGHMIGFCNVLFSQINHLKIKACFPN